jgi:protein ImuB
MTKRVACVYLGDWPIQRLIVAQPELRRQPVVLYSQDARGQRVSEVSPAARAAGVRIGLPVAEARAILTRLPQPSAHSRPGREGEGSAHFLPHDRAEDQAALVRLGLTCEALAPRVAPGPGGSPDRLFLDVTGIAHLFGGEAELRGRIERHFAQRGYTACVVLAGTIGAAWGLAQFGGGRVPFEQLPIEALRLAPATTETLRQLGVERVEQVRRLPRAELWARFGDEIHCRLDQAAGTRDEVLDWLPPPVEFYAQQFLDFPTNDATTIQQILAQLVEQLCRQMREAQRGGLQWDCRLYSPDQDPLRLRVNLFHPAAEPRQVLPLIRMHLEQLGVRFTRRGASRGERLRDDGWTVHHIGLRVDHCAVLVDRQRLLFDEEPQLDRQELAHLIDRLSARLGAERVRGVGLCPGAQPELAWNDRPLVGSAGKAAARSCAPRGGPPLSRPLWLHAPRAIEVGSAGRAGAPPAHMWWDGKRQRIVGCWGPERIETGWWRGPSVRRDYWRVELEDGRWLWLFSDLRAGTWFCHGVF